MLKTLLAIVLGLPLVVVAQQAPLPADRFEQNHEGLLTTGDDSGKAAGRFTEEATRRLPLAVSHTRPIPRRNLIDTFVFDRIERAGIPHSGLSTDEEFLRRAYLDAIGLLPTADDVRRFVASTDPQKRDRLIDRLVGTDEFAEQWAWFYGDLFRLNSYAGAGKNSFQYWNKEWLKLDRPYDQVVRDLIVPAAKSHASIPNLAFLGRIARNAAYKDRLATDPDNYGAISNRLDGIDEGTVEFGRLFLGINLECISCHNGARHLEPVNLYLAQRTRQQFFEQSAFLGKVRMIFPWQDTADEIIDDYGKGYDTGNDAPFHTRSESKFPRPKGVYQPAFILTGERPRAGQNPRSELARMITEHPQFSRATVNLLWGKLMTVGFVEPYDGFDLARQDPRNPPPAPWTVQPTNPELLDALAADFAAHGFSIHHLIKTIMKSSAYQLSSSFPAEWKDAYAPYYARKYARVMTGPEVVDSIAQATGRPYQLQYAGVEVRRVKEVTDLGDLGRRGGEDLSIIMESFFQGSRLTPPAAGNKATTMQAILMMRSDLVNERVRAQHGGRVQQLVESSMSNDALVEEMYLSTLSRYPTVTEKAAALSAFEFDKDRQSGAENLQWGLLNGIEFILNH